MLDARSSARFPSLAPPSCPWHENCTPMDCEFFRAIPSFDQYERPVLTLVQERVESVPIKPSKRGRK